MSEHRSTARATSLEAGMLWRKATSATQLALRKGKLQPIDTSAEYVEQDEIRFLVRQLVGPARAVGAHPERPRAMTDAPDSADPFLPYDPDMFVAELSATHVCLLNKYTVIDHHLLMVTRAYEDQVSPLTLQDFEAIWICLAQFEGLAFYNAGRLAGASQRHKHLQYVPLPLTDVAGLPIEPALHLGSLPTAIGSAAGLPFVHAIGRFPPAWVTKPATAARATLELYRDMLRRVGLIDVQDAGELPGPYNLLATREWMLIVPRTRESSDTISVNALGFAGCLLVGNETQMQFLRSHGPLTLLRDVAQPLVEKEDCSHVDTDKRVVESGLAPVARAR